MGNYAPRDTCKRKLALSYCANCFMQFGGIDSNIRARKNKKPPDGWFFFLDAVGDLKGPLASHSRLPCLGTLGSAYSLLWLLRFEKTIFNRFFLLTHSLRGGREPQFYILHPTQKGHLMVSFALDAGVGFERPTRVA